MHWINWYFITKAFLHSSLSGVIYFCNGDTAWASGRLKPSINAILSPAVVVVRVSFFRLFCLSQLCIKLLKLFIFFLSFCFNCNGSLNFYCHLKQTKNKKKVRKKNRTYKFCVRLIEMANVCSTKILVKYLVGVKVLDEMKWCSFSYTKWELFIVWTIEKVVFAMLFLLLLMLYLT